MENDLCGKDYAKYIDINQYQDKNPNALNRQPFSKEEIQTVWKWNNSNEYVSVVLYADLFRRKDRGIAGLEKGASESQ